MLQRRRDLGYFVTSRKMSNLGNSAILVSTRRTEAMSTREDVEWVSELARQTFGASM